MLLIQKWPFIQHFFFRQYTPGKCHLRYSRTKKHLSRLKKHKVQKVEKLTFFQRGLTHAFGPKMAIFPTFFLRHYRRGKCVSDILEANNTFLAYINEKFKKLKN